ncbi:MAG: plasmid mobilization protein [Aeromonas sp.]
MKVLSFRVTDQQKSEIEKAAKEAQMTTPDYMRKALTSNQIKILNGQIGDLMTGLNDLNREKKIISDEIETIKPDLAAVAAMTKQAVTEIKDELDAAAKQAQRIRKVVSYDDRGTILLVVMITWAVTFSASMLGSTGVDALINSITPEHKFSELIKNKRG